MPRKGPTGKEIGHYGHRRKHGSRLAVRLDPSSGGLLDFTDRRKLIAFEPRVFKTNRYRVVENMGVDQPLEQAEELEQQVLLEPAIQFLALLQELLAVQTLHFLFAVQTRIDRLAMQTSGCQGIACEVLPSAHTSFEV